MSFGLKLQVLLNIFYIVYIYIYLTCRSWLQRFYLNILDNCLKQNPSQLIKTNQQSLTWMFWDSFFKGFFDRKHGIFSCVLHQAAPFIQVFITFTVTICFPSISIQKGYQWAHHWHKFWLTKQEVIKHFNNHYGSFFNRYSYYNHILLNHRKMLAQLNLQYE